MRKVTKTGFIVTEPDRKYQAMDMGSGVWAYRLAARGAWWQSYVGVEVDGEVVWSKQIARHPWSMPIVWSFTRIDWQDAKRYARSIARDRREGR